MRAFLFMADRLHILLCQLVQIRQLKQSPALLTGTCDSRLVDQQVCSPAEGHRGNRQNSHRDRLRLSLDSCVKFAGRLADSQLELIKELSEFNRHQFMASLGQVVINRIVVLAANVKIDKLHVVVISQLNNFREIREL